MIYEVSCNTEDWSYDAENSDLHHRNKLNLTLKCTNISQFQENIYICYILQYKIVFYFY